MTSLPPAGLPPPGWYPDPDAAGTRWRWWDGGRWWPPTFGYDPATAAYALTSYRDATRRFGKWLRWSMAVNAAGWLLLFGFLAIAVHGDGEKVFSSSGTAPGPYSGGFFAFQIATLPVNLAALAYVGTFIAWVNQAGKFAEARGWPATRGRILGAFSVLIPIVNFWWPYEAVRDLFPPGSRPPFLLTWWLTYLIVPAVAGIAAFVADFFGTPLEIVATISVGAVFVSIPVVLGWRLVGDVDAVQSATSAG